MIHMAQFVPLKDRDLQVQKHSGFRVESLHTSRYYELRGSSMTVQIVARFCSVVGSVVTSSVAVAVAAASACSSTMVVDLASVAGAFASYSCSTICTTSSRHCEVAASS